jgi:phosphoglycolate phosphatase-like HAD superfamily hydrolase
MKLIVWDFDGTLVDSRPLIEAGMDHALKALALQNRPGIREEWLKYVGLPVEDGLRRTFEPLGLDLGEVLKAYRGYEWMQNERLIRPFEGMGGLLAELHGRGQKMAIASSKRTTPLKRQLDLFEWGAYFNPLVTPDQVTCGKPHPESLEVCLSLHQISQREALMIGDTPFDLEMAQRADVPSLAVGHGFYHQEALLPYQPIAYAPDVSSLREILLALTEN